MRFWEKKLNTCLVFQPDALFLDVFFFGGESRAEILKNCIDRFRFRWISHMFLNLRIWLYLFFPRSIKPLHFNLRCPCLSSFLLGVASKGSLLLPRNHGLNLILNKSAKCPKPKQKSNKKIQNPWKSTLLYNFLWIFVYKKYIMLHHLPRGSAQIISSSTHQIIAKNLECQTGFFGNVGSRHTLVRHTPLLSLPPKRTTAEPTNTGQWACVSWEFVSEYSKCSEEFDSCSPNCAKMCLEDHTVSCLSP